MVKIFFFSIDKLGVSKYYTLNFVQGISDNESVIFSRSNSNVDK